MRVLAHFRPVKKNAEKNKVNTRMEKLHFAFRMYDLDGDDKISRVSLPSIRSNGCLFDNSKDYGSGYDFD